MNWCGGLRTDAWSKCCFLISRAVQCQAWLGREDRERKGLMKHSLLFKLTPSPLVRPSPPFHILLPLPTKMSQLKLPPPRPFQLIRSLLIWSKWLIRLHNSGSKWVEDGSVLFPASHLTLNHLTRIQPALLLNPALAAGHLERIEDVLNLLLLIISKEGVETCPGRRLWVTIRLVLSSRAIRIAF